MLVVVDRFEYNQSRVDMHHTLIDHCEWHMSSTGKIYMMILEFLSMFQVGKAVAIDRHAHIHYPIQKEMLIVYFFQIENQRIGLLTVGQMVQNVDPELIA
jgi:hypothetical protein